jgi:hypothetical protein
MSRIASLAPPLPLCPGGSEHDRVVSHVDAKIHFHNAACLLLHRMRPLDADTRVSRLAWKRRALPFREAAAILAEHWSTSDLASHVDAYCAFCFGVAAVNQASVVPAAPAAPVAYWTPAFNDVEIALVVPPHRAPDRMSDGVVRALVTGPGDMFDAGGELRQCTPEDEAARAADRLLGVDAWVHEALRARLDKGHARGATQLEYDAAWRAFTQRVRDHIAATAGARSKYAARWAPHDFNEADVKSVFERVQDERVYMLDAQQRCVGGPTTRWTCCLLPGGVDTCDAGAWVATVANAYMQSKCCMPRM